MEFVHVIIRAGIPTAIFDMELSKTNLCDFVSVSTEAFILLSYRNGYQRWKWMHEHGVESSSVESAGGSSTEAAPDFLYTSQARLNRNGGWSRQGLICYKEYYEEIKRKREMYKEFSSFFLEWCKSKGCMRRKKDVLFMVIQ